MKQSNICKGCLSHDKYGICVIRISKYQKKCPCLTCIVSVMCREACDELRAISRKARKKEGVVFNEYKMPM